MVPYFAEINKMIEKYKKSMKFEKTLVFWLKE